MNRRTFTAIVIGVVATVAAALVGRHLSHPPLPGTTFPSNAMVVLDYSPGRSPAWPFKLVIRGDWRVTITIDGHDTIGYLTDDQAAALWKALQRANFFSIPIEKYQILVLDSPHATLTLTVGSRTRTLSYYYPVTKRLDAPIAVLVDIAKALGWNPESGNR